MRLTYLIKGVVLFVAIGLQVDGWSQYNWRRPNKNSFPTTRQYLNKGWIFGLNLNGTFGMNPTVMGAVSDTSGANQVGTYSPLSYMGGGIEVGQYRIFRAPKLGFKYIDYSLGYRMDRYGESMRWEPETVAGTNVLREQLLYANFNINWSVTTGRYAFLDIAPGVELSYKVKSDSSYYTPDPYPVPVAENGTVGGQLYFKIGYGYMWQTDRAIIWSLEVPVLNYHNNNFSVNSVKAWHSDFNKLSMKIQVFLFRVGRGSIPNLVR